ncbi:hypothetical protein [Actinokineospora bangkokensis]|uniref:Uncharacterized protein n=1 Tax=Actinokineospora bangkokensis TaxID=1193682 RepID=A0A1Q9LMB6_9PSEU|nr:hypothetical protein [Actinokineospora bangkokensis]OLR93161.1 hypothetical protein BJP25_16815 [Actinokineospora bangkokensis]
MNDLTLRLDAEGTPATVDRLTGVLFDDLRAARVGVVSRVGTAGAAGSKSGIGQTLGELLVGGTVPGSLLVVHRTIVKFLERSKARSVTVEVDGKKVTITAATAEETAAALRIAAGDGAGE